MLRKTVFWMHLVTGVLVGIVVLMMSVTGVVLTYEMQLNRWALRDYRASPPSGTEPLPVDVLLGKTANADAEISPSSVTFSADPLEPAVLSLGRGNNLYVDRYSGEIQGDGDTPMKRFMRTVMYWHRWFAMSGEQRDIGRAVTGASNLAFLFLVMSGFYLWWPRNWSLPALRNVTWFRTGLSDKARNFNWHNVIGFWMAIPLSIVVLSGVVISYGWAGDLVYTLTGSEPPSRSSSGSAVEVSESEPTPRPQWALASLEEIYRHAADEIPEWRSLTLRLPESGADQVAVSVDVSPGRQPGKRTEITFDRTTCTVIARKSFRDESTGRQLRSWLRFAHTGEVYGIVGQTVAGVATAGAAVLVWTGFALAWRRLFGRA